ncbi:uncharacterized protein PHACADRAFT_149258 [Phanerochaete carnosa HHB-10118-sp]|uniref:NAD-dependent epimerase/dehydratase domain-containing protein n=1 Tax=Phanerochaete carnosa (strain HHB-10118-sp) TaxID=650164 RepID=K5WQA8_PHACS|nr:uncharacterized protein PHACADRAFT_149258 [Phanerochaete carnosa HHB-10118-sp]EKM52532.1 hypothetical protein PHACADRAFT_149258 [Phanerochaete carnosa HHB-10118-sp]
MPAVNKGKVLVSGCNGFIAVWVVKHLLEEGFSVRGTVRRESSIPHLKDLFSSYGDKFEVVIVPDITKEGAFDEAVKGVDAIEHTASPFHMHADDPQEIIGPAVAGTVGMLRSALEHANGTVKRVVVTSSCSAVLTVDPNHERWYNEKNWNEQSICEVEAKGRNASNVDKYHASKSLAERAAWKFVEENRGAVNFDLVTMNPPYVYGPFLQEVKRPEDLNTSILEFYGSVVKGTKTKEQLTNFSTGWVDVRNVSEAHVLALQKPEAGGERIIVSCSEWVWQDFVSAAHKFDPSLPAGDTSYDPRKAPYTTHFDNAKSKRILGIEYHSIEECTRDLLGQFKRLGWY